MKEQNVEKLFKDTFSNFEADVNPSMWANIEHGLPSPQNIPGSSPVAKPAGFFSKVSLNTVIVATAISAALTGTIVYVSSQKSGSSDAVVQTVQAEPQVARDNSLAMNSQPAQVVSQSTPAVTLNNAPGNESKKASEKQAANKAEEKVLTVNPAVQTSAPAEKQSENSSNSNSNDNSISIQVSTEPNASKPANNIVKPGHVSGSLQKTNSNDGAADNSHPDEGKAHSINASGVASAAPENVLAEEETAPTPPVENEEQFRFFIPTGFTPNADMINDYFKPVTNTSLKEYEMVIYDRYGFEIFKTKDIDFGWDGKLRDGDLAATAVYVYIIKLVNFKGEECNYIDSFTLFK